MSELQDYREGHWDPDGLTDQDLWDALVDCFRRNNIGPKGQQVILEWCREVTIKQGLVKGLKEGTLDISVKGDDVQFKLTEHGVKYVERDLLPKLRPDNGDEK